MRPTVEFEDASAEQLLHARYRDGAAPAGDEGDTVDRAGDQPREIRSIAAWA